MASSDRDLRGTPLPPRLGANPLDSMVYGRYRALQNRHNKGVTAKIVFLNELAPEGVRGLLVFDLYIQYSGLGRTKMPRGCCCLQWVRWFWGLTCDFAEVFRILIFHCKSSRVCKSCQYSIFGCIAIVEASIYGVRRRNHNLWPRLQLDPYQQADPGTGVYRCTKSRLFAHFFSLHL